jgi:flagellar biosynthetic protein FlhB
MSEAPDKESKTENATEKKIHDAIEKGNVPHSREAPMFASLAGILLILVFLVGDRVSVLADKLSMLLDDPGGFLLDNGNDATALLWAVTAETGAALAPIIAVLAIAGMAASLFQNTPRFARERIKPQWSRVSPKAGWKRLFGAQGAIEFLKSLFKFATIAVTVTILLRADAGAVTGAMFSDPVLLPGMILSSAVRLVSAVCVATIMLVAADLVWAHFKWRVDLRMTRQEVKDEMKQTEGDPLVKSRLRSLARDRARRRMMSAVPKASVIIANPTHYAVALRYNRAEGGAPLVVAKGADLVALRIREIAAKHGVPIVEDKPLARALYDSVEVDKWIPPEFYKAVARILYYLYSQGSHARARK